jgi:adenylate cyclase
LQLIGGALASIAAIGAIAGGLIGYWTVWKTLRTEVFPDKQQTQREATARPDIAPRLSLVILPFANLNNDPEQDYFAEGISTDLTTDLAQMPGAFVIGRGTAFTYKNKQIDFRALGNDLRIRWAVQGAVRRRASKSSRLNLRKETSASPARLVAMGQQATSSATRAREIDARSANRRSDLTSAPSRPQTLQMKPAHEVGNGIS